GHAPNIEAVQVEVASDYGPYGAKGVGEPPLIPCMPAIANAIKDAIGSRITEVPILPEVVIASLNGNGKH
ncbi:MAG: nicotinate dehydrogenase medium molybdopterin subunit, partial [Chloroflexota bacterium]